MRNFILAVLGVLGATYYLISGNMKEADNQQDAWEAKTSVDEPNPLDKSTKEPVASSKKSPKTAFKIVEPTPARKPVVKEKASNQSDLNQEFLEANKPHKGATVDYNAESITIPYEVEGDYAVTGGDILVVEKSKVSGNKGEIEVFGPKLWKNGKIPYVLDANDTRVADIKQAIHVLNDLTNIEFIPRSGEPDYIFFKKGEGCYSFVGRKGGAQPVVLDDACKLGHIVHELIHVIGLFHEHMRYDRDEHVKVLWYNIEPDKKVNFIKVPETFMSTDILFDVHSIMMYGSNAFSKSENSYSIVTLDGEYFDSNRKGLTKTDVEKINHLYADIIYD